MDPNTPAETEDEKAAFIAYLERTSDEVDTWPEWKRNVFGVLKGKPTPTGDVGALDELIAEWDDKATDPIWAGLTPDHRHVYKGCADQLRAAVTALQRSESEAVGLLKRFTPTWDYMEQDFHIADHIVCATCGTDYGLCGEFDIPEDGHCTNPNCDSVRARAITTKEGDDAISR